MNPMGADLYIGESGYFRDSYNGTSVLKRLGLSWWKDVSPMLNDDELLNRSACGKLRLRIEQADLTLPETDAELRELRLCTKGGNSAARWKRYWEREKELLIRILEAGVKAGGIRCSL